MSFADEVHKHKPKDIKPQGSGSTLDADKVDGLHASEIGGGGGADEKIKVSATDTTTDYLQPKLVSGTGIALTKQNPSGNENLKIDVVGGSGSGLDADTVDGSHGTEFLLLDGSRPMTGDFNLSAHRIKTSNLLIKELDSVSMGVRNIADTDYRDWKASILYAFDQVRAGVIADGSAYPRLVIPTGTSSYLRTRPNVTDYFVFEGYTGSVFSEVARLVCASQPFFEISKAGNISLIDDKFLTPAKDSDGILPTADSTYRGKMIRVEGGTGVKDLTYQCKKKADDTYGWLKLVDESDAGEGHRKWFLGEEPSWYKFLPIPFGSFTRYGKVFDEGTDQCSHPTLTRYGDYYYCAYYSTKNASNSIWIARSTNLISWEKGENILSKGVSGSWEDEYVAYAKFLVDIPQNEFRIYYEGKKVGAGRGVGLSACPLTSNPMLASSWSKYAGNPLTIPNYNSLGMPVVRAGNLYLGYYLKTVDLKPCVAYSADGKTGWTYYNIVLDVAYTHHFSVVWILGNWFFIYSLGQTIPYTINLAASPPCPNNRIPGVEVLTAMPWNPVLNVGPAGQFDSNAVLCPSFIVVEAGFKMVYSGYDASSFQRGIGLATIP